MAPARISTVIPLDEMSLSGALLPSGEEVLSATKPTCEVVIRDKRTLEIRQFFELPRQLEDEFIYETSLYFYFPRSFNISADTYSRDAFYHDTNAYLRLHAPAIQLKELANLELHTNPAALLRIQLTRLLEDNAPSAQALETLAQTYGAELADAATTATRHVKNQLNNKQGITSANALQLIDTYCSDILRALSGMKRVRAKARAYRTVAPPSLLPTLAFSEEYATSVVDERIADLAHEVEQISAIHDGDATWLKIRVMLANTAEQILKRRIEQGFAIPTQATHEYFTYRLGLLKKEVQRALYVDTRRSVRDPFLRNGAAMIGAGIAAAWATWASFAILQGGDNSMSMTLFVLAVAAYILKDRLKEWTRTELADRLLKWDHDRRILGDSLKKAQLGGFSGRTQEKMRFVTEEYIPRDVTSLRLSARTVRGINHELEHVLHYERRLQFTMNDDPVPEGFGVQELVRFSVEDIIKRLDDPVDQVRFYDSENQRFVTTDMPKVYHLNLVAVLTHHVTGKRLWKRYRVVINQLGLMSVEPVIEKNDVLPPESILFPRWKKWFS